MGAKSKIEWTWTRVSVAALTADQIKLALEIGARFAGLGELLVPGYTFNPWYGCEKVSPACANCYAEKWALRSGLVRWGGDRKRSKPGNWARVLVWNALAGKLGVRQRVFCASLADWLDDEVPVEWLAELLDLQRRCTNLDFLNLTKRIENFLPRIQSILEDGGDTMPELIGAGDETTEFGRWLADWRDGKAPANIWGGVTVENQEYADRRIPVLMSLPFAVRFLSCEPLLEGVNLRLPAVVTDVGQGGTGVARLLRRGEPGIHLVIAGGESGGKARPTHPHWVLSLRDQAVQAGAGFLFKQWGEYVSLRHMPADTRPKGRKLHTFADGTITYRVGKKKSGRRLESIEHDGMPPEFSLLAA